MTSLVGDGGCTTVRPMLSDRCLSCPVCLCLYSLTLEYCGRTVGYINMPLCMEVGLDPGHIVLDGEPPSPTERSTAARHFSAHVYCGQTVAHLSNCCALVS